MTETKKQKIGPLGEQKPQKCQPLEAISKSNPQNLSPTKTTICGTVRCAMP